MVQLLFITAPDISATQKHPQTHKKDLAEQ